MLSIRRTGRWVGERSASIVAFALMAWVGPRILLRAFEVSVGAETWFPDAVLLAALVIPLSLMLFLGLSTCFLRTDSAKISGDRAPKRSRNLRALTLCIVGVVIAFALSSLGPLPPSSYTWAWYELGRATLLIAFLSLPIVALLLMVPRRKSGHLLSDEDFALRVALPSVLIWLSSLVPASLSTLYPVCSMSGPMPEALTAGFQTLDYPFIRLFADLCAAIAVGAAIRGRFGELRSDGSSDRPPRGALPSSAGRTRRQLLLLLTPMLGLLAFFLCRSIVDALSFRTLVLFLMPGAAPESLERLSTYADLTDTLAIGSLFLSASIAGLAGNLKPQSDANLWAPGLADSWRRIWPLWLALLLGSSPVLEPRLLLQPEVISHTWWQSSDLEPVEGPVAPSASRFSRSFRRISRVDALLMANGELNTWSGARLESITRYERLGAPIWPQRRGQRRELHLLVDRRATIEHLRDALDKLSNIEELVLLWPHNRFSEIDTGARQRWPAMELAGREMNSETFNLSSLEDALMGSDEEFVGQWLRRKRREKDRQLPIEEHQIGETPVDEFALVMPRVAKESLVHLGNGPLPRQWLPGLLAGALMTALLVFIYLLGQWRLVFRQSKGWESGVQANEGSRDALLYRPSWVRPELANIEVCSSEIGEGPYRHGKMPKLMSASPRVSLRELGRALRETAQRLRAALMQTVFRATLTCALGFCLLRLL